MGGLPGALLPTEVYDLVLIEAVHASDLDFPGPDPWDNRDDRLIQRILAATERECTRILIVSGAVGDAQEVYDALLQARQERYAPELGDYEIYLSGHAYRVARLYAQIGLYHNDATRGSELEQRLLGCGRRILHITNAPGLAVELKEV